MTREIAGDDVDLSRTVGWFTTKYPVALTPGVISWGRCAPVTRPWVR